MQSQKIQLSPEKHNFVTKVTTNCFQIYEIKHNFKLSDYQSCFQKPSLQWDTLYKRLKENEWNKRRPRDRIEVWLITTCLGLAAFLQS